MNKMKRIATTLLVAFAGAILAIIVYSKTIKPTEVIVRETATVPATTVSNISPQGGLPDLTMAAEQSVHSVVHITTMVKREPYAGSGNPLLDFFFGERGGQYQQPQPQYSQASGSGVIISSDGYIVTNNHVVENANIIEVVLNDNEKVEATLIGRDSNTDIALIKIDQKDLPYMQWGNSESLQLGEWVLAVGNPFNLTSTVTAGIVSAKSRSIGIMGGQMPLESFIQTDAAVNPGNSGGALVNSRGELIGINTAIASRTGSYSGYSFAIPASIAKKVVTDLKEYGEVQRALLGVTIAAVNSKLAEEKDLDKVEGLYVVSTSDDGAAKAAGIKEGDVITSINGNLVNTLPELQEQLGKFRPGDRVSVKVKRNGKLKQYPIVLRNTRGDTSIIKESLSVLGAEFGPLPAKVKQSLEIDSGIMIVELNKGKLKDVGVKDGFIITEVNKYSVSSIEDLKRTINRTPKGRPVLIEGVYPNGEWAYYVFRIDR